MQPGQYSKTALAAAFYRAQHHLHDEPKLLDDPYAHRLLTRGEMAALGERRIRDGLDAGFSPGEPSTVLARVVREITPASSVLARARYAEDRLERAMDRGVRQYVLVGAGLDSFALRREDVRDRLQVFELDHPQSQAMKRERLAAAGLTAPPNLHFAAVDFERERLADALARVPFRRDQPSVFAWLGVTMYLSRAAIESTWRDLESAAAPGSELVFDFIHRAAFHEPATEAERRSADRLRAAGEPIISMLDPATLADDLEAAGWTLVEQLNAAEIDRRYFATRTDGYRARPMGHLACAVSAG